MLQIVQACLVADLPLIGQPFREPAHGQCRQVDQQLCEVKLRIDIVTAAGRGQAGEDGRRSTAARITDEQAVLPVQDHALHLALAHVMPTAGLCRVQQSEVIVFGRTSDNRGYSVGIIRDSPGKPGEGQEAGSGQA